MARSKVGKPTGQVTQHGRQIYKTPAGEEVSEKSVTIPMAGKWVNAPSIWNGKKLTEDGVERAIREGLIKPTSMHDTEEEAIKAAELRSKTMKKRKYNAGGLGGSPALDYEQQMMEMESQPPEDSGEEGAGKALTGLAADLTPGIGEVRSAMDAKKAYEEGDALGVGLGVLGAVPGVGIGARGLKSFIKAGKIEEGIKKLDDVSEETLKTVLKEAPPPKIKGDVNDDPSKLIDLNINQWQKDNEIPGWATTARTETPEEEIVADAAVKLFNKEISPMEFRKIADDVTPYSYPTKMPKLPSFEDLIGSLSSQRTVVNGVTEDKVDKVVRNGVIGLNKKLKENTFIEARFDINAYQRFGIYTSTLQGGEAGGKVHGYARTVVLDNVDLKQEKIEKIKGIAIGTKRGGQSKSPIITMKGNWKNHNSEAIHAFGQKVIDSINKGEDVGWYPVSVNPRKGGPFVALSKDKETGKVISNPVEKANTVIQVGKVLLAKVDPADLKTWDEYYKVNEFNEGGIVEDGGSMKAKQQTRKLFEEGGMLDEGGTVDPESGNEVPTGSLQEEVRDDIPAQLSEGEFVFPADVVRFIGLERLMQMRQAAKRGLAQMDAMGQMGNSEEATMDDGDDTEFETEIDDILAEVEKEADGNKMPEGIT